MLVCDLCGGKDKVSSIRLEFNIQRIDEKSVGTMYTQDVCDKCHTKLYNMIHILNNTPALDWVLAKGLDCKNK